MPTYNITTNFGAKDNLAENDPLRVIKGSEFGVEFNNIKTVIGELDSNHTSLSSTVATNTSDITALNTNKAPIASPTFTGSVNVDSLRLGDSEAISLGNSLDFKLYHDGDDSYIEDTGTGNLYLRSDGAGIAMKTTSNEVLAEFVNDGAVSLYYNNTKKINTTNLGVTVTGNVETDGLLIGTTVATTNVISKVDGAAQVGGVITYNKSFVVLDTAGTAVAGLTSGNNGLSTFFEFKGQAGSNGAFHITFACHNAGGTWVVNKNNILISDKADVEYSAGVFTFKAKGSQQLFTPIIKVEALGTSASPTYFI